jgi:transcriptional regulator with XRE-family HTH domain
MEEQKGQSTPYTALGTHLKYLREQLRESLAEVSGAVEIDVDTLQRMEQGVERPSEDILMLLINHFGVHDNEAVQLWELAGYDQPGIDGQGIPGEYKGKPVLLVLATDIRTMYSDGVHVSVDKSGVTLDFTQAAPGAQQGRVPVARVGMSMDQAQQVLKTLEQALLRARYMKGPKGLPPPRTASDTQ